MKNGSSPQSIQVDQEKNTVWIKVLLDAVIFKEDGIYVSYCPAIDLYSQGNTLDEAEEMIADAVRMFILSCLERGVLNEVLKDCGFSMLDADGQKTSYKKVKRDPPVPHAEIIRQTTVPAELPVMAFG